MELRVVAVECNLNMEERQLKSLNGMQIRNSETDSIQYVKSKGGKRLLLTVAGVPLGLDSAVCVTNGNRCMFSAASICLQRVLWYI